MKEKIMLVKKKMATYSLEQDTIDKIAYLAKENNTYKNEVIKEAIILYYKSDLMKKINK